MPQADIIEEMELETIDDPITNECKTLVFKSMNQLDPEYLCDLFTRNSLCSSYSPRHTVADLRLPKVNKWPERLLIYRCKIME